MKVLVIGGSGMLGHTLFFELSRSPGLDVYATVRSLDIAREFPSSLRYRLVEGVDALHFDTVIEACARVRPEVIINAVGVIRQRSDGQDPLTCIELNARFPHRLAKLAAAQGARIIHISTDCVFDGTKGQYTEDDHPTAYDAYGLTKYLGELREAPAVTLRTSIIGHEIRGKLSLVEWFLAQHGVVTGYDRAIYTGLPTCELARVIAEYVLPDPTLTGLYHVASAPISKYSLLSLVAEIYGKTITIIRDTLNTSDKSLVADRFHLATGYICPAWPDLIIAMRNSHLAFREERK